MTSEADDLQEQAELQRVALADSLDQLRTNLKPDNLAQEALHRIYGDGTAAINAISRATRDNPVPVSLIGAGLAMVLGVGRARVKPSETASTVPALIAAPHDRSALGQIRKRPMLFGAVGVVLGAAIGALVD